MKRPEDMTLREFRERYPFRPGQPVRQGGSRLTVASWPYYNPDTHDAEIMVSSCGQTLPTRCDTLRAFDKPSLDDWRRTRRWHESIGAGIRDDAYNGYRGFVYAESWYVRFANGEFYTEYSNEHHSNVSLDAIEAWLYERIKCDL